MASLLLMDHLLVSNNCVRQSRDALALPFQSIVVGLLRPRSADSETNLIHVGSYASSRDSGLRRAFHHTSIF